MRPLKNTKKTPPATARSARLSPEERRRYRRHLSLPEVGAAGQKRLKAARVLIVGLGGLGSPLALYLAAAGVGTLGLIDGDAVDLSNLQRQVIHRQSDLGRLKAVSAGESIKSLNPETETIIHSGRLNQGNALNLIRDYDLAASGVDNFSSRYVIDEACVRLGRPHVQAAVYRSEGQACVFHPAQAGPCYRCLYPEPPDREPDETGVLGVLPGIMGAIEAAETIKLIVGGGSPLIGRLLLFDAWLMKFEEIALTKDPACPVCGQPRKETGDVKNSAG